MIGKEAPIHRQVLLFAFAVGMAVLLPVGVILFTHQLRQFKQSSQDSFESTAQIIASNASASVAFNDSTAAREILESLSHDRAILAGALYRNDGSVLATYHDVPASVLQKQKSDGFEHLIIAVDYKGEKLGQLYLKSDFPAYLRRTLYVWAGVYTGAVAAAALLAYLLSSRFRKVVADPLRLLARTVRDVTEKNDYSLRAEPDGPSEVVRLGRAFNSMLSEIERRDTQIADANGELQKQLDRLRSEIEERQKTEQLLRETHREMVRLSREAGMAEVASGVLHNIGNVLNSVNVGIEILADNIKDNRQSPARLLEALLTSPTEEVLDVFRAHPNGPALLKVFLAFSQRVVDQLNQAGKEVTMLRSKLAHLKDVITRQQSLAKTRTVAEPFDLQDAVKEALILCEDSILRSGAMVQQRLEGPTQVVSDRTYVIQVLVNLIRNTEAALKQNPPNGRIVSIRMGSDDDARRYVSISDNGCGIAPEKLAHIFAFGFTTKSEGHGFGLHSSANAARMLGGSLTALSDGPGRGASFILELPYYNLTTRHEIQKQENPDR